MQALSTFTALAAAALLAACASPPHGGGAHAGMSNAPHAQHAAAAPEPRLQAMQEMHQKMRAARTPAERQALMAEHMKALQGGMAMMKEKHAAHAGHGGKGGMGAMGAMGGKGAHGGMAGCHAMMAEHMATMSLMTEMMADRVPPAGTGP